MDVNTVQISFADLIRDSRVTLGLLRSTARELHLDLPAGCSRQTAARQLWRSVSASDEAWKAFVEGEAFRMLFTHAPGPHIVPVLAEDEEVPQSDADCGGTSPSRPEGDAASPQAATRVPTGQLEGPRCVDSVIDSVFGDLIAPKPIPARDIALDFVARLAEIRLDSDARRDLRRSPTVEGFDERFPRRGPQIPIQARHLRERDESLAAHGEALRAAIAQFELGCASVADAYDTQDALEIFQHFATLGCTLCDALRVNEGARAGVALADARIPKEQLAAARLAPLRDLDGNPVDRKMIEDARDVSRRADGRRALRRRDSRSAPHPSQGAARPRQGQTTQTHARAVSPPPARFERGPASPPPPRRPHFASSSPARGPGAQSTSRP